MTTRYDVLSLCCAKAGLREGRKVAQFITEWELAVRSAGSTITAEEFAEHWRESAATSYRRLQLFRATFPELGAQAFPHDLMHPLLEALREHQELPATVALAL